MEKCDIKHMNITKEQYARIEKCFPIQRGNVKIDNYTFINAILYIAENGANGVCFHKNAANETTYTKDLKDGAKTS